MEIIDQRVSKLLGEYGLIRTLDAELTIRNDNKQIVYVSCSLYSNNYSFRVTKNSIFLPLENQGNKLDFVERYDAEKSINKTSKYLEYFLLAKQLIDNFMNKKVTEAKSNKDKEVVKNNKVNKEKVSLARDIELSLGNDENNKPIKLKLDSMASMIVVGTTGSGKSLLSSRLISELCTKHKPSEFKLALVDIKGVEYNKFKSLPHLYAPIAKTFEAVADLLNSLEKEMISRYESFESLGVASISEFNNKSNLKLPRILVIFDEYIDLGSNKDINNKMISLVSKCKAAGIHFYLCCQRIDSKVISKTLLNNIPTRICGSVIEARESKTIIKVKGAEDIRKPGEMIVVDESINKGEPTKFISPYISYKDLNDVVGKIGSYKDKNETMYELIKSKLNEYDYISMSKIQRNFEVGFNAAGKILQKLQREGLVDNVSSSKGFLVIKK